MDGAPKSKKTGQKHKKKFDKSGEGKTKPYRFKTLSDSVDISKAAVTKKERLSQSLKARPTQTLFNQKPLAGEKLSDSGEDGKRETEGGDEHGRRAAVKAKLSNESKKQGLIRTARSDAGYRKSAKFLLLIGKDEAAKVLKHLTEDEVEGVFKEMAGITRIEREEAEQIIKEFGLIKKKIEMFPGGAETARDILETAFGKEKANDIFKKALPLEGLKPFGFMMELEYHQILPLLKDESSSVISVILPYLEPKKASLILESMEPEVQKEIVRKIAALKRINPEVLISIEEVLRKKLHSQGDIETEQIDGSTTLAGILKHMNIEDEELILKGLEEADPEVTREIKDKLYTIDIIFMIENQDLEKVMRDYADREIAIILKGKTEKVKNRLMNSVSSRRRYLIEDESIRLGVMRKSEVNKSTKDFLDYLKLLEGQGQLLIHRNDDYIIDAT